MERRRVDVLGPRRVAQGPGREVGAGHGLRYLRPARVEDVVQDEDRRGQGAGQAVLQEGQSRLRGKRALRRHYVGVRALLARMNSKVWESEAKH